MLNIRLLGSPSIDRDRMPIAPPRGAKSWGLLAYVLLTERPPARQQLAELFFADADDPLGALRWTLSELRRAVGPAVSLTGDPLMARLNGEVTVDVRLLRDNAADPDALLQAGGVLLDGVRLRACAEFESWLVVARHRLAAEFEAKMRGAAIELLAKDRAEQAIPFASRAVATNPLDEGNHILLVRSLAAAGDHHSAKQQVAVCQDLLRRELGVETSAALLDAAMLRPGATTTLPLTGRGAAVSQLEAGRAAIAAGAVDAGVECLRRAVSDAALVRDIPLQARAGVTLGSALVHALRGRDDEAAIVLLESIGLASQAGDRETSVRAHRELGYIEVQAGRRKAAHGWLTKARELADTDADLAAILGVQGMNASDFGDYSAAFGHLGESVERARLCGDDRQRAWSLSIAARAHLLRDEHSQAGAALAASLEIVRAQRWMAFLPWPQALQAEIDVHEGRLHDATNNLEQAWSLGCQLGDPCWEGMAARGLGLLHASRGDAYAATRWLTEAVRRINQVTDRYQWVHAYALDAAVGTALEVGNEQAAVPLVEALASLTARCEMQDLLVRAQIHQSRLGDPAALASARRLAATIDNPALTRLLDHSP
jgi:DNA-binding SARP family transcriptional activator